jgi:hypothetical protein
MVRYMALPTSKDEVSQEHLLSEVSIALRDEHRYNSQLALDGCAATRPETRDANTASTTKGDVVFIMTE